jgi:hypothetical protein
MTSDVENEKRGELAGRADGRCWAEHTTEHDDLRRVAAIEFQPGLDCYKALCDAVDPDNEFSEMEIKRYLFGDESAVLTNEYFAAFIEGARQFGRRGHAAELRTAQCDLARRHEAGRCHVAGAGGCRTPLVVAPARADYGGMVGRRACRPSRSQA